MAATQNMPDITFDTATLIRWGNVWKGTVGSSKKMAHQPPKIQTVLIKNKAWTSQRK